MTQTASRAAQVWRWLRRHRTLVIGIGVAGATLWLLIAAFQMISARNSLERAVDRLRATELRLKPAEIINGRGGRALESARRDFEDAYANMDSVFVAPIRILPVVGRHVTAIGAMSGSAEHAVSVVQQARREMRHVMVDGWDRRGQRVASMQAFSRIAEHALTELRHLDLGPREVLIGAVARVQTQFAEKLHEARNLLNRARVVASGMTTFLRGPTRYLVLAANNAEMRAGSGMLLSASVVTAEGGHLLQVSNQPTSELALPAGDVVLPPGDFADRWGWLLPNEEWRNLAATPNFAATASLARDMWRAKTGESVDGVMLLDPLALQALLATSGPITDDGVTLNADNVLQYVFHDQYLGLDSTGAGQARRDRLGDIADTAVDQFDQGHWTMSTLLDELQGVVDGRHLLAWSAHKDENRAWRAAGVSGDLRPDSLMVSVMNFGGNKLDQYLTVTADLEVRRQANGTDVRVMLALTNSTPEDDPGYILGGRSPGSYSGILAVDVPGYARSPRLEGIGQLVAGGPDGAATVLAGQIGLDRGETKTYAVTFTLPPSTSALDVEASARYPGVAWTYGPRQWSSGALVRVAL